MLTIFQTDVRTHGQPNLPACLQWLIADGGIKLFSYHKL